jgi:hypothetical protein
MVITGVKALSICMKLTLPLPLCVSCDCGRSHWQHTTKRYKPALLMRVTHFVPHLV